MSRGAHESRQGRKRKAKRQEVNTDTETEASAADDDENEASTPKIEHSKLGRIKRSFIRKVLSPLIGYGMDYDLLHFIYDLSMWTTVGAKKNVARQTEVPLRVCCAVAHGLLNIGIPATWLSSTCNGNAATQRCFLLTICFLPSSLSVTLLSFHPLHRLSLL